MHYYYHDAGEKKPKKDRRPKILLFITIFLSITVVGLIYEGLFGDNAKKIEIGQIEKQISELIYGKPPRNLSYVPKINADSEHTKLILSALNNEKLSQDLINHITSINVINNSGEMKLKCEWMAAGGCVFISEGKNNIWRYDIYLPAIEFLKDNPCWSYEHTLYHEIGHVDYYTYHNGELLNDNEREYYAENFADNLKKLDKNCAKSLRLFK